MKSPPSLWIPTPLWLSPTSTNSGTPPGPPPRPPSPPLTGCSPSTSPWASGPASWSKEGGCCRGGCPWNWTPHWPHPSPLHLHCPPRAAQAPYCPPPSPPSIRVSSAPNWGSVWGGVAPLYPPQPRTPLRMTAFQPPHLPPHHCPKTNPMTSGGPSRPRSRPRLLLRPPRTLRAARSPPSARVAAATPTSPRSRCRPTRSSSATRRRPSKARTPAPPLGRSPRSWPPCGTAWGRSRSRCTKGRRRQPRRNT